MTRKDRLRRAIRSWLQNCLAALNAANIRSQGRRPFFFGSELGEIQNWVTRDKAHPGFVQFEIHPVLDLHWFWSREWQCYHWDCWWCITRINLLLSWAVQQWWAPGTSKFSPQLALYKSNGKFQGKWADYSLIQAAKTWSPVPEWCSSSFPCCRAHHGSPGSLQLCTCPGVCIPEPLHRVALSLYRAVTPPPSYRKFAMAAICCIWFLVQELRPPKILIFSTFFGSRNVSDAFGWVWSYVGGNIQKSQRGSLEKVMWWSKL